MKFFEKPSSDLADRVPPGQHLAKGFPVLTYGPTPEVTQDDWQLTLSGLTAPKTLGWSNLMALPQTQFTADFHCVTTWSKLGISMTGVQILQLLEVTVVDPKAAHVMVHCYGGYTTNLAMEDFARPENFLVHTLDGEPLPKEHGGPARLMVPHLYGWKSAKWISGIEFLEEMELGFWERNGYHHRGEPWSEERYSDR